MKVNAACSWLATQHHSDDYNYKKSNFFSSVAHAWVPGTVESQYCPKFVLRQRFCQNICNVIFVMTQTYESPEGSFEIQNSKLDFEIQNSTSKFKTPLRNSKLHFEIQNSTSKFNIQKRTNSALTGIFTSSLSRSCRSFNCN
jgi:hypothetical protein